MDKKLQKIIALSNQLNELVGGCKDCISVEINNPTICETPGIQIPGELLGQLEGVEKYKACGSSSWFGTNRYGIRVFGIVEESACGKDR